ncbi:MAG: trypsin-like peptidase domain-containing protein [Myxococcales bacterium]|nr:trypsin-like peptidase domain-containing protein [Myxococcales bacterium]
MKHPRGKFGRRAGARALGVALFSLTLGLGCNKQQTAEPEAPAPTWAPEQVEAPVLPASFTPQQSLAPLIEKIGPTVVSIRALRHGSIPGGGGGGQSPLDRFFGPGVGGPDTPLPEGMGSGFIISPDGLVVTNHHVVKSFDRFEVKLADDRTFDARVLGSDPYTDLALLKLEGASGLPVAAFGSSETLRVGDWVLAIGAPMGLEQSATTGIISAKGRGSLGLYRNSYIDFLQTDAAISPGNSGGPLFNLRGEVVGINTAIHALGRGIGFAVPADQARLVIPQLEKRGAVVRGWLGISGRDVEPVVGKAPERGALVGDVHPGTPAAQAGVREGDRILSVDGRALRDFGDLRGRIAEHAPGDKVALELDRAGKREQVTVTLGELPSEDALARLGRGIPYDGGGSSGGGDLFDGGQPRLGVEVRDHAEGLEITGVDAGSLGARLGLQAGDVITSINGDRVRSAPDVAAALGRDRHRVEVAVQRGSSTHTAVIDRR